MIKNDSQLKIVREQMTTAEAALDSLRRDVLPQNKKMYDLMAEPNIEMILSLRGEMDTYLGIAAIPETADLVISLEGDNVGLGRTSAASVTRIIDTFRKGLQSAVSILESKQQSKVSRRRPRWIENICDLPFVGVTPGSVKILLGEPESQSLFSEEERQSLSDALDLVFNGLHWADLDNTESSEHPFAQLPDETRQSMLGLINRLLPPRSGAIERVAFQRRSPSDTDSMFVTATLTRESRNRIRGELESLASQTEFAELEGVIREVDLDSQTFVLRERPKSEPDLPCEYGSELEDAVKEYLDCSVMVAGSLETSRKTKKPKMAADTIELAPQEDVSTQES